MKEEGLNRRQLLAGAAALTAGLVHKTPLAQAFEQNFGLHDAAPTPDTNEPEKFRAWFNERTVLFKKTLERPDVQKILNQPVDEKLDLETLDTLMGVLFKNWPRAYGNSIQHLPEHDTRKIFVGFPATPVSMQVDDMLYTGNGSLIMTPHDRRILTARHVVEPMGIPFVSPPRKDIALIKPIDLISSNSSSLVPIKIMSEKDIAGHVVEISGYHTKGAMLDENKKVYVSPAVPITKALAVWLALHHDKSADPPLQNSLTSHRLRWSKIISERSKQLPFFHKLVENYQVGNLVMLPPEETSKDTEGIDPAEGMSGSPTTCGAKLIGVFIDGFTVSNRASSYSVGIFNSDLGNLFAASKSA